MAKIERVREVISGPLTPEYLQQRIERGWKAVAIEWERVVDAKDQKSDRLIEDVPFGLKVADDCLHLEEHPGEKQALLLMMELIVQDKPLSQVAEALNRQGFRTRQGSRWTPVLVFNLLPRLIEVGPRILSSEEWSLRRQHFFHVV